MSNIQLPTGFKLEDGIVYGSRVPGLFEIKIHRPQARNATNGAATSKMKDLWIAVSEDPTIKLVVIHGGKFFSAGNDLMALVGAVSGDKENHKAIAAHATSELQKMLIAMQTCKKPTMAIVRGGCHGI
jgi:enoyl-CoA hydratase/carnithine racemase